MKGIEISLNIAKGLKSKIPKIPKWKKDSQAPVLNNLLNIIKEKDSILCASLDAAEFSMKKSDEDVAKKIKTHKYTSNYLNAIGKYICLLVTHSAYWEDKDGIRNRREVYKLVEKKNIYVLEDSMVGADEKTLGLIFKNTKKRADAITLSPFTDRIAEAAELAKENCLGVFVYSLIGNPRFEATKNSLVPIERNGIYNHLDIKNSKYESYINKGKKAIFDAAISGVDGIIIDHPEQKTPEFIYDLEKAADYCDGKIIAMLRGIKNIEDIDNYFELFGEKQVIAYFDHEIMFPKGVSSSHKAQGAIAEKLRGELNYFNKLRNGKLLKGSLD